MNLNKPLNKGIVMGIIVSVATVLSNLQMPETKSDWTVFFITLGGSLAGYFAQGFIMPGTSEQGQINGKDFVKALLVSLSNFVSGWLATYAKDTPIQWGHLAWSFLIVFAGYIVKQFTTPPPKA